MRSIDGEVVWSRTYRAGKFQFNVSIPRRRQLLSCGELCYLDKPSKGVCSMNRDTICVQGGYTPGNGEPDRKSVV